ncbi:MAG: hypothetical protein O4750_05025, partial [Trichodesmium sp. St18_bin3_1_1]|nr:hypothetical protein [Trichodesmium sp. St18_bin3_1_1]
VSRLVQPLLRLFSGEAPEDSPLRDYIFQEFMAGRKGLAVRTPEELREELRRKYSQQVGWRFWFQWVLANMVGGVVGFFVGLLVVQWANNIMVSFRLAVFGTVFGAVVGSLQWWVLRKRLSQARWWILATALASAILFSTAEVLSNAVSDVVSNTVIQEVVIFSVVGLVIGSAQWLVLRKQLSQSHWWILASVLGITATLFAIFYYSRLEQTSIWNLILWLGIFGIVYGVITGFALVLLLRQPGNSVINNKK